MPLLEVILEGEKDLRIPSYLKGKYSNDPFLKHVVEKPKEFKNFEVIDDIVYLRSAGTNLLCIPNILFGNRRLREILITHAHSILAHLRAQKTLTYL